MHNAYRVRGGEERAVELHGEALAAAGVEHRLLERDSAEVAGPRVASALMRGGEGLGEEPAADIVHVHNMHPLFGPRALADAKEAGAKTVLTLHNFRLFCAIGVAFRDGEPCFRCHHGNTAPGLVLNCRDSLPEAGPYAIALARAYPRVLELVDAFVAPSKYAAGQLERLGVPRERLHVIPHYVPDTVTESRAADGAYALVVGRLAAEKGTATAIEAANLAGVPLKVAGDGPLADELPAGADMLGRVGSDELADLRAGAAVALAPSWSDETFGLAALEAMAAGLPVIASRTGALPETVGPEHCVPRKDARALAAALTELWDDSAERGRQGAAGIERARAEFGPDRFTERVLGLYRGLLDE